MTQKQPQDDFMILWLNKLSEQQRRIRTETAFRITSKVAKKQIDILKKLKKKGGGHDLRFIYFYETVKSIWEHAKFTLTLGKGKNRKFAFYPARTVFENTFRLEYFSNQKKDVQETIARKECLRVSKRYYDKEMANNNIVAAKKFRDYYNIFSKNKFSDINTIKVLDLNPFPNMRELTRKSKIDGAEAWYFHYQALAEETHGKLISLISIKNNEAQIYRQSLMYVLIMTNDVLKNTDFHLKGKTRKEVVEAIEKAEQIVKKSI